MYGQACLNCCVQTERENASNQANDYESSSNKYKDMEKITIIFSNRAEAQKVLQMIEDKTDIRWHSGCLPTQINPFKHNSRVININYFKNKELTHTNYPEAHPERSPRLIKKDPHFKGQRFIMANGMTKKTWGVFFRRLNKQ